MTEKINTKQLKPVATALSASIDSSTFVMTLQLKDQNNNNIGSAQTIDLPIETMVVSGSYDADNKEIVLTLQNGQTIKIPVGDLISGLQTEITSDNMLDADLVDDATSTNKFVTASDKTTWNNSVRSVATGSSNGTISVNTGGTSAEVSVYGLGSAAYTASTAYDASGAASTAETNAKNYADGLASNYATAAQGSLADTAVQPGDLANYVTTNTTQTISGEKTFSGKLNYCAGMTYILAGNGGTKLGYWSYDIDGQSNITLQTMTASTRNINFKTNNGGKVTYNGSEIAKVSDLPSVMTGATAGDAGTSGLVPAPAAGDQAKFLQGDGTWANPTAATAWGNITGTLSNQTDLYNALDAKSGCILRRW